MVILGRLKMQDWNLADQIAGLENARLENVGPENAGLENVGLEMENTLETNLG